MEELGVFWYWEAMATWAGRNRSTFIDINLILPTVNWRVTKNALHNQDELSLTLYISN